MDWVLFIAIRAGIAVLCIIGGRYLWRWHQRDFMARWKQ
jgi:hypothetical protein